MKQKSLFDLARESEPAPVSPTFEDRGATDRSLSVVVNDYPIDAIDVGEEIYRVAVELKVGDDLVLIEVGLPRVDPYHVYNLWESMGRKTDVKVEDLVTIGALTVVSAGETFVHQIVRHPDGPSKYAYRMTDQAKPVGS